MKVNVYDHQRDISIKKRSIKPIVEDVLHEEGFSTNELSVTFVNTAEICELHAQFFNDPSPTDCITLPLDEPAEQLSGYHVLGEIFICPTAALDFPEHSLSEEITLYLVHGILHLIGYDDIKPKDVRQMRAAEKKHMQRLIAKKLLINL